MHTLGGFGLVAGAASAAPAGKRVFVLEQFFLKNGSQQDRMHHYIRDAVLPAMDKILTGPKIYLQALVAPHMPQVAAIIGFESLAQIAEVRAKVLENKQLMKAYEEWENHPEPAFESLQTTLLEAADYCPEIKPDPKPRKTQRVFELRVYHSPTWRQLRALHERFAGPEIRIFHRVGVHPILYSSTMIGANMPNLVYLTPFENLAAREKAWDAFGADPEWVKVRKESIDQHGQVTSVIQIALYKATPYSPIQ